MGYLIGFSPYARSHDPGGLWVTSPPSPPHDAITQYGEFLSVCLSVCLSAAASVRP